MADVGNMTRAFVGLITGKVYLAHLGKRVIPSRAVGVRVGNKNWIHLT